MMKLMVTLTELLKTTKASFEIRQMIRSVNFIVTSPHATSVV